MKRLRSPNPNRKGEYEVHVVPSRRAGVLQSRGWVDIDEKPLTESLSARPQFDISGKWMSVRSRVRDELGITRLPQSKDEARVLLEDAGYEVVEE